MKEFPGDFDKLFFSESVLGKFRLNGEQLIIPIKGLFVLGGHPLQKHSNGPYAGEFVFCGVVESRRTVTEYVGDARNPAGFKEPYEARDAILPSVVAETRDTQEFAFEGYQAEPSAWIDDWIVRATSFLLRVELVR